MEHPIPAHITVPCSVSGRVFQRFAWFDTLKVQKKANAPLLFAAILLVSAFICLSRGSEGVLLFVVLSLVALVIPGGYFLTYWLSIRRQAKALDKLSGKVAYTLQLDADSLRDSAQKSKAEPFLWANVHHAWRTADCVYLYVTPRKAYLLPSGQADTDDDALWAFLQARLGSRCTDRR